MCPKPTGDWWLCLCSAGASVSVLAPDDEPSFHPSLGMLGMGSGPRTATVLRTALSEVAEALWAVSSFQKVLGTAEAHESSLDLSF